MCSPSLEQHRGISCKGTRRENFWSKGSWHWLPDTVDTGIEGPQLSSSHLRWSGIEPHFTVVLETSGSTFLY